MALEQSQRVNATVKDSREGGSPMYYISILLGILMLIVGMIVLRRNKGVGLAVFAADMAVLVLAFTPYLALVILR